MAASVPTRLPNWALQPVSGMQDWYHDEMAVREWLFGIWDKVSQLHNFRKYDAPVLEHGLLYTHKRGNDDILSEMYSFQSEGKTVCLRPELTPTLVRMAMTQKREVLPLKWFANASCFRFETVSSGRRRLFHQWNADVVGGEPVKSDVEVLSLLIAFLEAVQLSPAEVSVKISHRGLLQAVFESLGLNPGQIGTAFNLVDKLEKLELADFRRSLVESLGLADPEIDRVLAFTSARSIQDLEAISIPNSELWQASLNNLYSIWALAEAQGIGAWLKVNTSVVRGLAYYDGMTFECNYNGGVGRQRALCGGGRYDHLMSDYDPSFKLPCVGFAVGDIVVTELLIELGRLPDLKRHVTYCLGAVSDDLYRELVAYAKRGRDKGLQIDICGKSKFKQILAYADKIGAEEAVIFAPTEWADGRKVILKELRKGGGQSLVPVEELF